MGRIALFLEMEGRRCLVVGGGGAAFAKSEKLLGAGAEATVVSPVFMDGFDVLADRHPGRLRLEKRKYRVGEACGYNFVVAATGNAVVDASVADDAGKTGSLANIASLPDGGGCSLAAELHRGPVTVAVSTSSASPPLASTLRDLAGDSITPWHGLFAEALGRVKERLGDAGMDGRTGRSVMRRLSSPETLRKLSGFGAIDELEKALWELAETMR
ncbi:MAG: bifunctional precorrin-2 dehydrogenase/sirohydrochlorin ferrochelatase [Planctomycetota bacterium]|jgi:precorrin-2 dehydrogenase/sirohydrochlorin ferrochelatase|nr:bifunctional precorrin-2 dehydrogenase/sirohydrochlorin ferrochelatase [Planctomycetota bacterium]